MGSASSNRRIFPWRLKGTTARSQEHRWLRNSNHEGAQGRPPHREGGRAATSAGTSGNSRPRASRRIPLAIAVAISCSFDKRNVTSALVNDIPFFSCVFRARASPVASIIPERTSRLPIPVFFTIYPIQRLLGATTVCAQGGYLNVQVKAVACGQPTGTQTSIPNVWKTNNLRPSCAQL